MTISLKAKLTAACAIIFILGFVSGFVVKQILYKKAEYDFQYKFEKLAPLTKELGLSDVQKALLFNILADNRNSIDKIMRQVNPKIQIQLHIMRENIKAILDDGQKASYSRMLKESEAQKSEEM